MVSDSQHNIMRVDGESWANSDSLLVKDQAIFKNDKDYEPIIGSDG